ncbi:MAG: hypothetical protein RIS94_3139 [Pseudomonadota bacterium]|jgi:hypothetical protein
MLQRTATILIERFAFWICAAGAVTMALLPKPPKLAIDGFGDKFEHMLAFGVLAALAAFAFPAAPRWRLIERLSFMGALIEVAQSIPALHRDCDIRDWVADTLAVLVMFGVLALLRLPRRREA